MKSMLAVAVVALAALSAAVAGATRPATASPPRALDLTARLTSQRVVVDSKPAGYSAGDLGIVSGDVFDHGKKVGRYTGTCMQFPRGNQQCTFVLGLPGGQIIVTAGYGPGMNVGSVTREAIIGGTGVYEGARGQGLDRELNKAGTLLRFHIHLLP